jgi:hypothetical protein
VVSLRDVTEDSTNISNNFLVFIALQQPTCSIEKLPWIVARTVESSQIWEFSENLVAVAC